MLAAEDLTQQHHVFESQIAALGDSIQRLNRQTQHILQGVDTVAVQREGPTLKIKIDDLNRDYDRLIYFFVWKVHHRLFFFVHPSYFEYLPMTSSFGCFFVFFLLPSLDSNNKPKLDVGVLKTLKPSSNCGRIMKKKRLG